MGWEAGARPDELSGAEWSSESVNGVAGGGKGREDSGRVGRGVGIWQRPRPGTAERDGTESSTRLMRGPSGVRRDRGPFFRRTEQQCSAQPHRADLCRKSHIFPAK